MGRADSWPKNHRPNGTKAHEIGVGENSIRQICARIYFRNENWAESLHEPIARSGEAPNRKSWRATARIDGLARKNVNLHPRCRAAARHYRRKSSGFLIISPYDARK